MKTIISLSSARGESLHLIRLTTSQMWTDGYQISKCLLFFILLVSLLQYACVYRLSCAASHLWGDCNNEKHLNVMFFRDVQNVKYLRRSPLSSLSLLSSLCIDLSLSWPESHGPWSGGNLWRQLREREREREDR